MILHVVQEHDGAETRRHDGVVVPIVELGPDASFPIDTRMLSAPLGPLWRRIMCARPRNDHTRRSSAAPSGALAIFALPASRPASRPCSPAYPPARCSTGRSGMASATPPIATRCPHSPPRSRWLKSSACCADRSSRILPRRRPRTPLRRRRLSATCARRRGLRRPLTTGRR